MAGALSRAAQARAETEAAAKAEADAQEKARLDAEAASKAEAEPEPEDDKEKPKGKKAEGDCPKDDEEDMDKAAAADPGTVAQMCADANVPHKAKGMIDAKLPLAEVKARLAQAADIKRMCEHAHSINPSLDAKAMAEDFDRGNASLAHAGKVLLEKLASMQSPEIRNTHAAASGGAPGVVPQGNHGWDKAIEKVVNAFAPPVAPKH